MKKINELKEKIKKNFKENKVLLIVFVVVWVIVTTLTLSSYSNTLGKQSIGNEGSQNVAELTKTTKISQTIDTEKIDGVESIAIKFATYARKDTGNVFVKVIGNTSKNVYVDETLDAGSLEDNDFVTISLSNILETKKDKTVNIEITSDSEKETCAGIYFSNNKAFDDSVLKINNQIKTGDLSVRFLKTSEDLFKFYKVVITWVIITFSIVILLILLLNPKMEVVFTIIALVFGLTFWIIITPMSVPDETVHYEYSMELSNMMMGKEDYRVVDKEYQNYGSFAGHYNISAAYTRLVNKIDRPLSLDNEDTKFNSDIKNSYPIAFVPQAIGVTIARLLNMNMLKTFYMGRLFNLIFYVACIYVAIKNTPIHKLLFGIIGTLPIFMQQAASFSYDCYINGLSLILISFVLKWKYQEEKISIKDFIFVFIVNLLIAPVKVVYGLFSFLFWFVPKERFGSKKNKIIGTLIVTAPAMYEVAVLTFPLIFRIFRKLFERIFSLFEDLKMKTIYAAENGNEYTYSEVINEDELYSFSDVTDDPLNALMIIVRSIRYNIKIWFYGSFGRTLSGNTLVVPISLIHALLALLVAVSFRKEAFVEPVWFKFVSIGLCVMAGLMMVAGLLISWTSVNQEIIEAYGGPIVQGVQGRYFSPMLPYCFAVFNNKKFRLPEKIDKYALFIYLILVFEIIVYILSYTFVN